MNNILTVKNLNKIYKKKYIVKDLSFTLQKGDILILLGLNGAGKTTALKSILGLISRNSGEVKFYTNNIGVSLDNTSFFNYMTGYDNLLYVMNLGSNKDLNYLNKVIKMFKLEEVAYKKVKQYSLGMKQKLGLARAIINHPELVILDEPTIGLDPLGLRDLIYFISDLSRDFGVTFLISTHLLEEFQKICSKILVLKNGKTVLYGKAEEFIKENKTIDKIFLESIGE